MNVRSHAADASRRTAGAIAEATLLLSIAGALVMGGALLTGAAPGGAAPAAAKDTTASIVLVRPSGLAPAAFGSWPALGLQVNFKTTSPTNVKNPRVQVRCYQPYNNTGITAIHDATRGYLTYGEARGAAPSAGDYMGTNPFVLGGGMSAWLVQKGDATCYADLFYYGSRSGVQTYIWLASVDPYPFAANG